MRRGHWGLLALALLVTLLVGQRTWAQGSSRIEQLTVTLMPQYDDPRLRIVYEVTLEAPGALTLPVPPGVELRRAAYRQEDGSLQEVEATFQAAPEGRFIQFATLTREGYLELYQDAYPPQPQRALTYTLPASRDPIAALRWIALFPPDVDEIELDPPMEADGSNHLGMPRFERVEGALPAGTSSQQSLRWYRESSEPFLFVPPPTEESAPSTTPQWLALALFLLGLALVLHGLWRQRRARLE